MGPHPASVRRSALAMVRSGLSNAEAGRRLGVPAGTVGYWLHLDRARRGELPGRVVRPACPRCDGRPLDEAAYSYLLGLYLGDGHIAEHPAHRSPSLMIACAEAWPGLMDDAEAAMRAVFPDNRVCRVRRTGCRTVKVYSTHLTCLFPQHGPGRKHERRIVLAPWQRRVVDAHTWAFVRGLVHSDGCRTTNRVGRVVDGRRRCHAYPRYFFTNRSEDVLRLYTDALDRLGVAWTIARPAAGRRNVSVARRGAVELMDRFVGPKR